MIIVEMQLPAKPGVYELDAPVGARFLGAIMRKPTNLVQAASMEPVVGLKVMFDEKQTKKLKRSIALVANGSAFQPPMGSMVDFIDCAELDVGHQQYVANVVEIVGAHGLTEPREA